MENGWVLLLIFKGFKELKEQLVLKELRVHRVLKEHKVLKEQ